MRKFLSHYTAACHWNIPYIDHVLDVSELNKRRINQISDITVTKLSMRYNRKNCKMYSYETELPYGALIKCGVNLVASPELLFLQFANILDFHHLILLGLQMCSHPSGRPAEAITTKEKLGAFIKKTTGHRGNLKAKRALKHIENGSASIMESLVFLFLTLPNTQGGYGLCGATFNHEVQLEKEGREQLKQNRCFIDVFYKGVNLAIEYDSHTHHSRPEEQGKDMKKATALERQGFSVINIGTSQLYNKTAFRECSLNIAKRLGKRIRIRTKRFDKAHDELRKLLP